VLWLGSVLVYISYEQCRRFHYLKQLVDSRHLLLISADTVGHGDIEMSGTGVLTYDFAFKQ